MADVAERAGTSAPSILYYFASKAELLKEALTSAEERFYEELERELEEIESARERLVRDRGLGVRRGRLRRRALDGAVGEAPCAIPELAATRAELDGRWRQTIAEVVSYGQERGEFGPADPRSSRCCWPSLLDGLAVQIALQRRRGHARTGAGAEPALRRARARLRACTRRGGGRVLRDE